MDRLNFFLHGSICDWDLKFLKDLEYLSDLLPVYYQLQVIFRKLHRYRN